MAALRPEDTLVLQTVWNLAIAHTLQSQAHREVNAAFHSLDDSANRALSFAMPDADPTLTTIQVKRNHREADRRTDPLAAQTGVFQPRLTLTSP